MRGPFSTPITPLPGSLFHADPHDAEEARLAEGVEKLISYPPYEPFLKEINRWLGWPRESIARAIAAHRHEDNGHYFSSLNEEALSDTAYVDYLFHCKQRNEEPVERNRWLALRAQADSGLQANARYTGL